MAHGLDPRTPAAVVSRGTRADQRGVTGTVATIAADAEAAGVGQPATLVVGHVVPLRAVLADAVPPDVGDEHTPLVIPAEAGI